MSSPTPSDSFKKLEELQDAFTVAQEALPFLEQIFQVVQELVPLFDEINSSLRESTSKIPHATSQLRSISESTEVATTEILDLTEEVLEQIEEIESHHEACAQDLGKSAVGSRLMQLLREELGEERSDVLRKAEHIYETHQPVHAERKAKLRASRKALEHIHGNVNQIMVALQVQDITSQKIAAVNHLIESMRERMSQLLDKEAYITDPASSLAESYPAEKTFDPHAEYDRSSKRQDQADALIASFGNGTTDEEVSADTVTSQNDIDKLFETQRDE